MKVILKADVQHVGKAGQIVKVKNGFARNYLIPRKLAQEATEKRIKELNHLMEAARIREKKLLKGQHKLLEDIAQAHLVIHAPTGKSERLFGTVTNAHIASALEKKGLFIDRKHISIETPIKTLGQHNVAVSLGEKMKTHLVISVERQITEKPQHKSTAVKTHQNQTPDQTPEEPKNQSENHDSNNPQADQTDQANQTDQTNQTDQIQNEEAKY